MPTLNSFVPLNKRVHLNHVLGGKADLKSPAGPGKLGRQQAMGREGGRRQNLSASCGNYSPIHSQKPTSHTVILSIREAALTAWVCWFQWSSCETVRWPLELSPGCCVGYRPRGNTDQKELGHSADSLIRRELTPKTLEGKWSRNGT